MGTLEIIEISPGATIQDGGRPGLRRFGVTGSGAMDGYALAEGQALLGNRPDAAALEMFANGGVFRALSPIWIALSGAEMECMIGSSRVPWRASLLVEAGEELRIGRALKGTYGYLHVAGGIDGPVTLGSRSTHAASGMGWVPEAGQHLISMDKRHRSGRKCLSEPGYFDRRTIRIIDGPQSGLFGARDRQALVTGDFTISGKRDRMGIKLEGRNARFDGYSGLTLASDAIVPGDIQVAGDGVATVLLADSQPAGGYPRIANVISADQHVLAQFPSGKEFGMEKISPDEAVAALAEFAEEIRSLPGKAGPLLRDPATIGDLLAYSMISGVVKGDESDEN